MSLVRSLMGAGMAAASAQQVVGDVLSSATATGTTQATALEIGHGVNVITTVASGTGVVLSRRAVPGDAIFVYNDGANDLNVYPYTGETINGGSTNAAVKVTTTHGAKFTKTGNTAWRCEFDEPTAWISTDTVTSRFYRADATFNGTVDHGTIIGYNLTGFGQIEDASKSSLMLAFEADYNDGSVRTLETHWDMAVPGGSFKRPFSANMAITGGNAGLIVNTEIYSDLNVITYSKDSYLYGAADNTVGASYHFVSLDTGGKDWWMLSTGSGSGLGAGNWLLYNNTDGRHGLICDGNGNVVTGNLAAIATNATDGFLYVPACAGTPTGTPTSKTGKVPIVVDSTNNKLYFYSGGAWRDAGP